MSSIIHCHILHSMTTRTTRTLYYSRFICLLFTLFSIDSDEPILIIIQALCSYMWLSFVAIDYAILLLFSLEYIPYLSLISAHYFRGITFQEHKITSMIDVFRVSTCYVLATSRAATYQIVLVVTLIFAFVYHRLFLFPPCCWLLTSDRIMGIWLSCHSFLAVYLLKTCMIRIRINLLTVLVVIWNLMMLPS